MATRKSNKVCPFNHRSLSFLSYNCMSSQLITLLITKWFMSLFLCLLVVVSCCLLLLFVVVCCCFSTFVCIPSTSWTCCCTPEDSSCTRRPISPPELPGRSPRTECAQLVFSCIPSISSLPRWRSTRGHRKRRGQGELLTSERPFCRLGVLKVWWICWKNTQTS